MPQRINKKIMLGFLNYQTHPEDSQKRVFYYRFEDVYQTMQAELQKKQVPFETYVEDDGMCTYYIIVKRVDFDEAYACNAKALTAHKKPFLADKGLRIFIFSVFFVFTTIAIVGYIVSNFF